MPHLYYTPNTSATHCTVVKKSKFITFVTKVASREEAVSQLSSIAAREVGANHNCSAYIIGNPSSPDGIHCSDDGEPSGTAGKPLLNILLHENIGNVLVVVTRYFGGIKLGSGGLVRAYSAGLKLALKDLVLDEYVVKKRLKISFHYQFEGGVRRLCERHCAVILEAMYKAEPCFYIEIVDQQLDSFVHGLQDVTGGRVQIDTE